MSVSNFQPLHQRLTDELRSRITSGTWPEGFQIPSEAELCREFEASRGTVRQALSALRAEGLILGGRGKQPVAGRAALSQPFTTFMSFTEWAGSIGRVPGQQTREVAKRPASPDVAAQLGLEAGEPVVEVLRLRLLGEMPAMVERTSFVLDVGRLLFDFDTDSGSIFSFLKSCGVDLSRGRHTIDAVAADELDAELLGVEPGSPLLRERRVTSSAAGEPIEFSDDRYVPGLTNFTIENTNDHRANLVRVPTSA
ncbi:GntR family transcriptional regulator [Pseudarthrobacter sp. J64]|uniref:GntR family transcriptional regulator n=1 Tax=Pseudarthrobacter sp. J64 TaxID=3116485 RepID=UPI002E8088CF|nr:GntR family transcriptional regulator [Pseudarthrobacter sp. J64]MEE2570499.1 GntR family transcriptional regulator [Pseudarthrobacter sp. J64]